MCDLPDSKAFPMRAGSGTASSISARSSGLEGAPAVALPEAAGAAEPVGAPEAEAAAVGAPDAPGDALGAGVALAASIDAGMVGSCVG